MGNSKVEIKRSDFPQEFIFGSGTSAYQVEGAWNEGGKGKSNWDCFTLDNPDRIADRSNGCIAADHYHMFKDDVALMKKVGLDTYRFSIAWSRILPGGKLAGGTSKEGIKFYNDLIDELLAEGIKPWATLFHWDIPQCLEDEYGGFLNNQILRDFCDFAEVCFQEFGDRVKHWITLNEPWSYTYMGYVSGFFPPGRGGDYVVPTGLLVRTPRLTYRSPFVRSIPSITSEEGLGAEPYARIHNFLGYVLQQGDRGTEQLATVQRDLGIEKPISGEPQLSQINSSKKNASSMEGDPGTEPYIVAHKLILAHARAVEIYRTKFKKRQGGKIGISNVAIWFYPYTDTKEDAEAVSRALDFTLGWFVAPIVIGDYPASMKSNVTQRLPEFTPDEVSLVKGSYDFLGINYYTTYYAKNVPKATGLQQHHDNDRHVQYKYERGGKDIGMKGGSDWLYIVPDGIYRLMLYMKEQYNNPEVYITENGVDEKNIKTDPISKALNDETRIDYHNDHLVCLKKAIGNGVCLKGYFIWSLLDNFEWAAGYTVRFGISYVDFGSKRLTRFSKKSIEWWINFLKKPKSSKKLLTEKAEEEQNGSAKRQRVQN